MKFPRAIFLAAIASGASLSCHMHSSASASFSFDASFGSVVDAGSPPASELDASTSEMAIDAGANPSTDVDGGAPSDFALRFERTACLGTCPMYVVHVDSHGAVRFSSRLFLHDRFVDGCASKNIGARGVTDLQNAITKYRYFSLKDAYSGGPTDAPSVITRVTVAGKTKTVNHYTAASIPVADKVRLNGIEDTIDEISGAADFANQAGSLTPCTFAGK